MNEFQCEKSDDDLCLIEFISNRRPYSALYSAYSLFLSFLSLSVFDPGRIMKGEAAKCG